MSKIDEYRDLLLAQDEWDEFLKTNSGLPGPRGNIELALAAGEVAPSNQIRAWLRWDAERAPTNSPEEFLAFCGVIGLGRLTVEGDSSAFQELLAAASDGRWRVREGVAMALQHIGDDNFDILLTEMRTWARGTRLEQRAAAAALCEPRLLSSPDRVAGVIEVLNAITETIVGGDDRRSDAFRILRKGLGYCWSVAVVAAPSLGKQAMERWIRHDDPDVRWVMRQNLGKKRMQRMDAEWVRQQSSALAS